MWSVTTEKLVLRVGGLVCRQTFIVVLVVVNMAVLGCTGSQEDSLSEKQMKSTNSLPVDLSSLSSIEDLQTYLGRKVRITGTAIDGKGFEDLLTNFGGFLIDGEHTWPVEVVGTTVEVEGVLRFVKQASLCSSDFDEPCQESLPNERLKGWYSIADMQLTGNKPAAHTPELNTEGASKGDRHEW